MACVPASTADGVKVLAVVSNAVGKFVHWCLCMVMKGERG
jgi:hypothetical protein